MKYKRLPFISLLTVLLHLFFLFSTIAQTNKADTLPVYFSFGGYSINKENLVQLNSFLDKIIPTVSPGTMISIVGYTDTAGTEKYNAALSMRRCRSVNSIIEKHMVASKKFSIQLMPMGEQKAATGADSLNRRVDVIFFVPQYTTKMPLQRQPVAEVLYNTAKPATEHKDARDKVIDTVIVLDYIYFEPDLPVLTSGSVSALPYYVSILKKYRNNEMEIGGHVNHTDSKLKETDPLFKLSEKRAKEVYEYLIDYGFDSTKLSHKGYGNSKLLFPSPANLEEKRKNMRVEITVYKKQ
jgi:outer membrane protein OmpA-like peptidoglycan-associated protein